MAVSYIGIGSNLGNRQDNIDSAIGTLRARKDISVEKVSRIYETEPEGGPKQGKFLNAVLQIETKLTPLELLNSLKKIESDLGRKPADIKWSARIIDLDILLYDDMVFENKDLIIPHPLMHKRWFVLKPLSDIAKDAVHPVFKKTINELLKEKEGKYAS